MESYLLLECSSGMVWDVADAIVNIEGVKMAHVVTGQFDVMAYAEFADMNGLMEIIEKFQSIKGVLRTQTAVAIPPRIQKDE